MDGQEEENNDDDGYLKELAEATDTAKSAISTWDAGSWVVVRFGRSWFPGTIQDDTTNYEDGPFHVSCMERKPNAKNLFKWPSIPDVEWYDREDMLLEIDEVVPRQTDTMTTVEMIWCALNSDDYRDANHAIKRALRDEDDEKK